MRSAQSASSAASAGRSSDPLPPLPLSPGITLVVTATLAVELASPDLPEQSSVNA